MHPDSPKEDEIAEVRQRLQDAPQDVLAVYSLAYEESVRRLDRQREARDGIRDRSLQFVALVTAASSFLVGTTLDKASTDGAGFKILAVVGSVLYILLVVAGVRINLPVRWTDMIDAEKLIANYAEADPPFGVAETKRNLALYYAARIRENDEALEFLRTWLRLMLLIGSAEFVVWLWLGWAVIQ